MAEDDKYGPFGALKAGLYTKSQQGPDAPNQSRASFRAQKVLDPTGIFGKVLGIGPKKKVRYDPAASYAQAEQYAYDPSGGMNAAMGTLGAATRGAFHEASAARDRAGFDPVTGAQIATGDQDEARRQQMQMAEMLAARARGDAISPAELQMRQALGQMNAQSMGRAASTHGLSPGMAMRMANQNIGAQSQNMAGEMAVLRAQEQARAEQGAMGAYGDIRSGDLGLAEGQASLDQQATLANLEADIKAQQLRDAQQMGMFTQGMAGLGTSLGAEQGIDAARQASVQQEIDRELAIRSGNIKHYLKQDGAAFNALGGIVGGLSKLSDKTTKVESETIAGKDIDEWLEKLSPKAYEYKDEWKKEGGEGEHYGIMAQDMLKSRVGKGIVEKGSDGKLRLDVMKAFSAMLAAQSRLAERLKGVEGEANATA